MITQQQISEAAQIIKSGGFVAFPTETVYGLGADALNANAVASVFAMKERPSFDPLIVHISDVQMLKQYIAVNDERLYLLAQHFWPGPLTLVAPRKNIIPDIVTSGLPTVGIRMPANDIALRLIDTAETPIAAPSANKFGKISPTRAEHVRKQFPQLQHILDGGSTKIGIESTVISLDDEGFIILRPGAITAADLLKYLPQSGKKIQNPVELASPGMLKSHYSPDKALYIIGEHPIPKDCSNAGLLAITKQAHPDFKLVEYLSHTANLEEIAVNLFGALYRMEEADIDFIVAERVPEQALGIAIMDRLRKAAWKNG